MHNNPYTITDKLHVGPRYVIYRGIREGLDGSVILKMLKDPYPGPKDLARLRYEYALLQKVVHPNIVRVIETAMVDNRLALVRDEVQGVTLAELARNKPVSTASFFTIASQLASAVQALHRHRIIHKNINASNILYNPSGNQVVLSGFSLASEMSREALLPNAQDIFEAELEYISPEQTGRLNRNIDYRTDFYSLGIVLYELLTGQPPFVSGDAMELIHSHIAIKPAEPESLRPDIPPVLSQVVMKLLKKNEEDRYQSAAGLLYDLAYCQKILPEGNLSETFSPGSRDISDQFHIPGKLYGRKAELDLLSDAFLQAESGQSQALLVAGYSGVGKSKLVHHLQKSVEEHNGFFVSGKFDQFKRDLPLSAPLSAFRSLIRQLLSGNENQIATWRAELMEALGGNGQVMIDVVPELELLIGPQPPVPELPVIEANNRFNQILSRFLRVFCTPAHPLCMFLDDLQWIDSATRQWIENQLNDQSLGHFLLIGAYRNNEVTPSHPLVMMTVRLQQNGVTVRQINLEPLDPETLKEMLADTLVATTEDVAPLADMIYQKTNGNPFFTRQCLLSLYENGAIYFSNEQEGWLYDLEKARNAQISDNVVDMMSGLILRLPDDVQDTLKLAACMGNQFNLQTISIVSGEDINLVNEKAGVALQKGLIVPFHAWHKESADEFAFLHDRVHQAALTLLPEDEKKMTRLTIGRLLLKELESIEKDDKTYDIADHLNYAADLITDESEKQVLASLNLSAGIRAKKASAYETARRYTKLAMDVLPQRMWASPSALTASLLVERADSEHLCGYNEEAEVLYDKAVSQASSLEEKSSIYQRKIHYYTNLRKFGEAYQTGRQAVMPLGVNLPSKFIPPLFVKDLITNRILLGRRKIGDIINLKEMTDERLRMAIQLMATFGRAAYQIKPELCVAICTRMANICLQKGNTDGGFIGFLALGPIFLGAILKQRQTGYEYGQLILELVEKYRSSQYKAETHFVVGYFAMPWRRPASEMEGYWEIAYEAGLQNGDFFHASCAACGTIQSYYMRGMNFEEIVQAADRYLEFLQRIQNTEAIRTIQSVTQSIKNLTGQTASTVSYDDDQFSENSYVSSLGDFASRHFAHYYFINKMQTLYLWGEYEKAYEIALVSDRYLKDSPGMMHTAEHYLYKGLIICALFPLTESGKRKGWMHELNKIDRNFKQYAAGCADNFLHKSQLLSAEICKVKGDQAEAEKLYYAAIESASRYRYQNVHALANERLVAFHLESGKNRLAALHLEDAVYSYKNLGANAYAESLLKKYPSIASRIVEQDKGKSLDSGLAREGKNLLDLETVLKSSEAISREIRLHDLLSALMKIIIENAGAQRMVLLLKKGDELVVQGDCLAGTENIIDMDEVPFTRYQKIPRSIINYVLRTNEPVMLDDASVSGDFTNDVYVRENQPKSILCIQLIQQGKMNGIIYLENNLTNAAFTKERIDLVTLLSGQMAISIENAFLYENLEEKVKERTRELKAEKDKSDTLLLNILPAETAEELKKTGSSKAKEFSLVTVLFTDFKNFTSMSEKLNAQELVSEINYCYSAFDDIISKYGIEKIKTIGDSYMCAGGLPVEKDKNPVDTLMAALEIRDFMLKEKLKRNAEGKDFFEIRIGLHSGPVVAGIVGTRKFAYDIWGDTVNIASRMESSGAPGKVNISGTTYELVKDKFECTHRGMIEAKNKGLVDMYFVEKAV